MGYSFKIINSSAGSGKTFKLAIEYISKLLISRNDEHFKSMLALTFTNKASAEMKDRILLYLSKKDYKSKNAVMKEISIRTGLNESSIKEKSSTILEKILYNYSYYHIITIDSFTNNIIKTENPDKKDDSIVELDNRIYIEQAVEELISEIDDDNELKNLLVEFANYKILNNKSWDIAYDLIHFSLFLDKESNRDQVDYFKKKNFKFFSQIRKKILSVNFQKIKYIHDLRDNTLGLIYQNGLDDNDFRGGYFTKYLKKLITSSDFKLNESTEKSLKGESSLYNKTLEKIKVEIIERIRPKLLNNYLEIKKSIIEIDKINSSLSYLPSLSLISRIEDKIDIIQNENNIRLISKFNSRLNSLIKSNEAPEIYERLGSKYLDFFIDEFQDTSKLQWKNLIPLISNPIHSESHDGLRGSLLIVGDPKQSIYRWRGGEFNQFIDLINNHETPFHFERILDKPNINYRSSREIVDFNSDFFTFLSNRLDIEEYKSDDLNFEQKSYKDEIGYVSIDTSDKESLFLKIENQILDLLNRGYYPSEIVILVRKNKHAKEIIDNINNQEFEFISSDILQIQNSDNVQFIISIFKLSLFGNNYVERKKVIEFLYTQNYFESSYESLNHCFFSNLSKIEVNDFFSKISNKQEFQFKHFKSLDIHNAINYCASIFKLDLEDPFIIALMDNIFEFLENNEDSIKSYLNYWERKSEKIMLSMPDNQNSISISTIHKSKGLEYPAVIIPIYDDNLDENISKDLIWLETPFQNLKNLKWTLMRTSKKLINMGQNANEIYHRTIHNNLIDSINLLYVAFTRAERELFIISDNSKKQNSKTHSFSSLVNDFLVYKSRIDIYKIGKKIINDTDSKNTENELNNIENKVINIRYTSKNVNQAKYVSNTLSEIYNKDKSAKVYVFFGNEKLVNLVNIYDTNQYLRLSSYNHFLDLKSLDYDYVIMTNMNEGFFPFTDINNVILEESKKIKFDNKSQEEQEEYIHNLFYELIDRAKEVHLIYDSDLTSFMSGEESRYIKQIEFSESDRYNYNKEVIRTKKIIRNNDSEIIKKDNLTSKRIDEILTKGISVSTLNKFINNPYVFYQEKILGINDYDESNYLNFKDQGTLFHSVIDKAYSPYINKILEVEYFDEIIKKIDNISNECFIELNSNAPKGKDVIFIEVLKKCIINLLNYEKSLIEKGNKIKILSLENNLRSNIKVKNNLNVPLIGTIDRIDTFNNRLRIIDYKSGNIDSTNLDFKNFEILRNNHDHKCSNMLQLLFYKLLASEKYKDINELGLCLFKKHDHPFEFIENSEIILLDQIEHLIRDIIESIIDSKIFKDSGNLA